VSDRVLVVVLAGGASRRFGTDKLDHDLDGTTLLDRALAGVPADLPVVVVGPSRTLARPVTFVPEDPPGGGPGAALISGLHAALDRGADVVVTLPGDAPDAGAAVPVLLRGLVGSAAAIGVDPGGRQQPLQVALSAAAAQVLIASAGATAGAGASVRRMLGVLDLRPVPLDAAATLDIDTPEQARDWSVRER
jgi:molybdopterin-guanine dinucleotide biosynthesis protein A